MSLENVPRCQHLKVNGTQCGSPALRRRRFCFFHVRARDQHARLLADQFAQSCFQPPVLEDANAIQMALSEVIQRLAYGRIDHKAAGLMLYALQTAAVNLKNTDFEPETVTDVVIDRGTVARMNGPQWFEEDFDEEEEEQNENEAESAPDNPPVLMAKEKPEAEAQPTKAQPAGEPKNQAEIQAKRPPSEAEAPPKKPSQAAPNPAPKITISAEEARMKVQKVINDFIIESCEGRARRELGLPESG